MSAVFACGETSQGDGDSRLRVVATTSVIGDLVSNVGGDRVSLYVVIKPNVDAHGFEPSPKDLTELKRASVIVMNGVGFEEWLSDTIAAGGGSATVVDSSDGLTLRRSDDGSEVDPHIWHNPRHAVRMVANIANALAAADPTHAMTYKANAARYTSELEQLDVEIEQRIGVLSSKKLVTNHDAFGYYIDRYGLELVGSVIPSFEASADLSAREISELVAKIKAQGVRAVFSESALPSGLAKAIANEAGVKIVEGEEALYGDGLGLPKGSASTYLSMMRHNTSVLVANLG